MAKGPRKVRYRVIRKCFVGGTLHAPGAIIEAEEGLEGTALAVVKDRPAQPSPFPPPPEAA
jgi:hypothetical protein